MTVPNIFALASGSIPLEQLDTNFATPITIGTTPVALGGTVSSLNGVTLVSPTLTTPIVNSPTLTAPVLGTPTSGTLTNCTNLPIATGVSGLAAGASTFLINPTSGNLATLLTDETGTGAAVFATSPTLTTPTVTALNGGQLAGLRNRIINGACTVQQRSSVVMGVGQYGGPDRFFAQNIATGGTSTQLASTLTYNGVVRPTVRQRTDTSSTSFTTTNLINGITQFIEGYNCYDLLSKFITVSFIFNTNVSGTYSFSINDSSSTNSYVSTFSATANTPAKKTISLAAIIPSGAVIPNSNTLGLVVSIGALNQATYQTATLNTWLSGKFISASGATNWAATAGNFIELTELQLEIGSVATPFERRPYGMELALCQRYFIANRFFISGALSYVALPNQMRLNMSSAVIAGGGAGFALGEPSTSSGLICSQTSASGQTMTISVEL